MAQAGTVELVDNELFDRFGAEAREDGRIGGARADFLVDRERQAAAHVTRWRKMSKGPR